MTNCVGVPSALCINSIGKCEEFLQANFVAGRQGASFQPSWTNFTVVPSGAMLITWYVVPSVGTIILKRMTASEHDSAALLQPTANRGKCYPRSEIDWKRMNH